MFLPLYLASIQWNLFSYLGVGVKPQQNFVCEDVNTFPLASLAAEEGCGRLSKGTKQIAKGTDTCAPRRLILFERDDSCSSHMASRGVV